MPYPTAYLTAVRRLAEVKDRQRELSREMDALGIEREQLEQAVSIPIAAACGDLIEAALPHLTLHGEVDHQPGDAYRYDDYDPNTRRRLLDRAMEDVASGGWTERMCKTYARWYDQVCSGSGPIRHGTLTFGIFTNNYNSYTGRLGTRLDDEQREAVLHVLALIRDGVITTAQYTALRASALDGEAS